MTDQRNHNELTKN